jgi:SAM-dependent methyltransferase
MMDNKTFWNERYRNLPVLGSGPGSRAHSAWLKRRLLQSVIADHGIRSILDIGCGDMFWLGEMSMDDIAYTGVDISDVIVAKNREKFPRFEFVQHDVATSPLGRTADLVVCLDVLIHQLRPESFRAMLSNVLACMSSAGMISYETPCPPPGIEPTDIPADVRSAENELRRFLNTSDFPRAQTAFHGDLVGEVRKLMPQASIGVAGSYYNQTIYEVRI